MTEEPKTITWYRQGIISVSKMDEYNNRRKQAHETNNCALCGKFLNDKRKIYCNEEHRDQFWEETNYWIVTWESLRYQALVRDNNKCLKCGLESYLEVDHIVEIADGGPQFKLSNLQVLCHYCHLEKTAKSSSLRAINRKIKFVRLQHIPLDEIR